MLSKIEFTLKCLLENKLRFFLTILSVCAAVSSMLLISALGTLGIDSVGAELDSLGLNGLIVSCSGSPVSEKDIEQMNGINGIERCAPVTMSASKVSSGISETNAVIWGIDENAGDVVSFDLLFGRIINKGDIKANSRVCMVDSLLAKELFGTENAVGKSLDVMCGQTALSFEVAGVVKTGKGVMQSLMGDFIPAFLYVPCTSFCSDPDYTQIFVKTDGTTPSEGISGSVMRLIGASAKVTDMAAQKDTLENMLRIVTIILGVIGGVSLFVSGISIMNIMLISVNERTKEIGIKKSIGASDRDIMLDFLLESVIIAFTGTFFGIASAWVITFASSIVLHADIAISVVSIIISAAGAAVLGLLFGIAPAYKASKLLPVEALRR